MPSFDRRDFLKRSGGGLAALALAAELAGAEALLPLPYVRAPRDSAKPINVGVLGTGARGREAIEELATIAGAQVIAICDEDGGRLKGGKRRAPEAEASTDVEAFFANPMLHAVVICTPTHRHRKAVEHAVERGLHVYCETPLAHTISDARAIAGLASVAQEKGRAAAAGFTARANPLYKRTRGLIQTGGLERVIGAKSPRHHNPSWRAAAPSPAAARARNWRLDSELSLGLAGEEVAHDLDYLMWATKLQPEAVHGRGQLLHWQDGRSEPDTVWLQFPTASGGCWTADLSLANSHGDAQVHIHGVAGTVRAVERNAWLFKESDAPTQGWEVYATRIEQLGDEGLVLLANATKLAAQDKLKAGIGLEQSAHWYALDDFIGACMETKPPACSLTDALPASVLAVRAAEAVRGEAELRIDAKDLVAD